MEPVYIVSAVALVVSIFAVVYVRMSRVIVNVYNIDGQEYLRWTGKVQRNTLRLPTDGDSVIVSDKLLPLHGQSVTILVLLEDL